MNSINSFTASSFFYVVLAMLIFATSYYLFHYCFFAIFDLVFGVKEKRSKSFVVDFGPSVLTLIMWMISYIMVNALPYKGLMPRYIMEFDSVLPFIAIFLAFLAIDFIEYTLHYLFHKIPALWKYHQYHHNPKQMNWSKAMRISAIESFNVSFIVNLFILIFFGKEKLLVLAILFGVKRFYGLFLHSNTDIAYGQYFRFINSPRFHHWHHSTSTQEPKNLSTLFPIWDKLFGTYYGEGTELPKAYGIM